MGSDDGGYDEKKHRESVAAFSMDETEVTLAQYRECVNAGTCQPPQTPSSACNWGKSGRDQHPMNC